VPFDLNHLNEEIMEQTAQVDKNEFLYPCNHYHGQFKPENLVFDANLQEFAQRVSYIYSLENSGKLDPEDAYSRIETLWKQLERTKKQLGIGENLFQSKDGNE
jgi:hypothetical protein